MESKQDLRVIKTKKNIRDAFIQLLLENDFNAITIQNILDKALINRKTFYNHYKDKYDLAEQLIQEFSNECKTFFEMRTGNFASMDIFLNQVDAAYRELYERKELILALWNVHTDNIDFYGGLKNFFQVKYVEMFQKGEDRKDDIEFQAHLFSALILSSLKYMLDSDKIYTAWDVWSGVEGLYRTIMTVSIPPCGNK